MAPRPSRLPRAAQASCDRLVADDGLVGGEPTVDDMEQDGLARDQVQHVGQERVVLRDEVDLARRVGRAREDRWRRRRRSRLARREREGGQAEDERCEATADRPAQSRTAAERWRERGRQWRDDLRYRTASRWRAFTALSARSSSAGDRAGLRLRPDPEVLLGDPDRQSRPGRRRRRPDPWRSRRRALVKAVGASASGDVVRPSTGSTSTSRTASSSRCSVRPGSGKTTTLRMIAGFELPTAGRILLHGEDVTNVPPFERDVNTVFQDYALFPHMTVDDNVGYGLIVRKVAEGRARATGWPKRSRMVRLEGYEERKPGQLSGGQRQRVALARALVNRPRASCCSTNRSVRSISSFARRCRSSSSRSSSRSGSPSSTSPTTRRRRSR